MFARFLDSFIIITFFFFSATIFISSYCFSLRLPQPLRSPRYLRLSHLHPLLHPFLTRILVVPREGTKHVLVVALLHVFTFHPPWRRTVAVKATGIMLFDGMARILQQLCGLALKKLELSDLLEEMDEERATATSFFSSLTALEELIIGFANFSIGDDDSAQLHPSFSSALDRWTI